MKEQNFKNHVRFVFLYHVISFIVLLATLIGSVINIFTSSKENMYSATLILVTNILIGFALYFARSFALKANDRAIRAEENFRHFILTSKPLPTGLKSGQIIALRFASDEEFPALVQKAMAEQLKSTEIKQLIQNWKADWNRV